MPAARVCFSFRLRPPGAHFSWGDSWVGARETIFELPPAGGLKPHVTVLCLDFAHDEFPAVQSKVLNDIPGKPGRLVEVMTQAKPPAVAAGSNAPNELLGSSPPEPLPVFR